MAPGKHKKDMHQLVAALRSVQEEYKTTRKLKGEVESRANARINDREDQAYRRILRYTPASLPEFHQKLLIMLEANSLRPVPVSGLTGGSDTATAQRFGAVIARDADRLFNSDLDADLLKMCSEYHALEKWACDKQDSDCWNDDDPGYAECMRKMDRRFALFWKIARKRARTAAGLAAKAGVLPYQVERGAGPPTDDRVEVFAARLAEDACRLTDMPNAMTAGAIIREVMEKVGRKTRS